jgi:predicted RNase H-like HicB family nuclease
MKIIALKDSKDRGYTAFHRDFPSVITQCETLEEVKENLVNAFTDILMHSDVEEKELKDVTP